MQPLFFDEFDIDEQFQKLKKCVNELEPDIYKFISPTKNRMAAVRARKQLGDIKKLAFQLRKAISKQKAHNSNEY